LLLTLVGVAGLGAVLFFGAQNERDGGQATMEHRQKAVDHGLPRLRYLWKKGQRYIYSVQLSAGVADGNDVAGGQCFYHVRSAGEEGFTLAVTGNLLTSHVTRDGIPILASPLRPTFYSRFGDIAFPHMLPVQGEIISDPLGKSRQGAGQDGPPAILGNLVQMVIEPLPPERKKTWEGRSLRTLKVRQPGMRRGPFEVPDILRPRIPMGPWPRGLRGGPAEEAFAAEEHVVYTLETPSRDTVVIRKKYELKTQALVNQPPRIVIEGEGRITFDIKKGLPRAQEFQATLVENTGGVRRTTPLKLAYKLLEGKELAQYLKALKQAEEDAKPKPLTTKELTEALGDLRSGELGRRRAGAQRLAKAVPKDRRSEVAKALVGHVGDQDVPTRQAVARALAVWATREEVPALAKAVADPDYFVRAAILDALGRLKDARAAAAVAQRLADLGDHGKASQVLQAMGPEAAKVVVEYLPHQNLWTRLEACKILKIIGTKDQVAALQKTAKDKDPLVARIAEEAIKEITQRK
jgi:hypothetical protein